jgi:hypothetical protein
MAVSLRPVFERKLIAAQALAVEYAERCLQAFRDKQPLGTEGTEGVWHNRTGQAAAEVFSDAFVDDAAIGFFLAHGKDYGVWLELANDRKYEVLRPIVESFAESYFADLRKIYAD